MVAQGDDIPVQSDWFAGRVQRPLGFDCYTTRIIIRDAEELDGRVTRHGSVKPPSPEHTSAQTQHRGRK